MARVLAVVLLLVALPMTAGFSGAGDAAGGGSRARADLVVSGLVIAAGSQTYGNITVQSGGELAIPAGAVVNAVNLTAYTGSAINVSGGVLNLSATMAGGSANLRGFCSRFEVTGGGAVTVTGENGFAQTAGPGPYNGYLPTSMGGGALLSLNCTAINLLNSTLTLTGGKGFSLPPSTGAGTSAWSLSNLTGDAASGGSTLLLLNGTGRLTVENMAVSLTGGRGGDAAAGANANDALRAWGGGYSSGGSVSGRVGAGGDARATLSGGTVMVNASVITGTGGNAGNGGTGGTGGINTGGGGGGYAGGNIAGRWPNSAVVAQGGATFVAEVQSSNDVYASYTDVNGQDYMTLLFPPLGIPANAVIQRVIVTVEHRETSIDQSAGQDTGLIRDDVMVWRGGNNWAYVGDTTQSTTSDITYTSPDLSTWVNTPTLANDVRVRVYYDPPALGDILYIDYATARISYTIPGWSVSGDVGTGGSGTVTMTGSSVFTTGSQFIASGGTGGSVGNGSANGTGTGGGGGGYGGGAGGFPGANGGGAQVSGRAGDGGNATVAVSGASFTAGKGTLLQSTPGWGGNGTTSPGTGANGGLGLGRTTADGRGSTLLPMSVPLLRTPATGTLTTERNQTFSWGEVADSTTNGPLLNYIIQLSTTPGFSSPTELDTGKNGTLLYPLPAGFAYYWRVKAVYSNPFGATAGWSSVWNITIDTAPSVTLLSPARGAVLNATATDLAWRGNDPDGNALTYDLYFDSVNGTTLLASGLVCETYRVMNLVPGAVYWWSVVPDDGLVKGTPPPEWNFSVKPNAAPVITLVSPADSASLEKPVVLAWYGTDADGDALTYSVFLDTVDGTTLLAIGLAATEYTPPALDPNTTYYWSVQVTDGAGGSARSPVWRFTVKAAPVTPPNRLPTATLASPANGTTVNTTSTLLTWYGSDADGDRITYILYLDRLDASTPAKAGLNATSYPTGNLTAGVTYFWKVVPHDGKAEGLPTPVWRFTVAAGALPNGTTPNRPPRITSTPGESAEAGKPYTYALAAVDDDNDTLIFTLVGAPPGMEINATTGLVSWTPVKDQAGRHTVVVAVGDGKLSVNQTFTIDVAKAKGGKSNVAGEELNLFWPFLIIVLLVAGVAAGGGYYYMRRSAKPVRPAAAARRRSTEARAPPAEEAEPSPYRASSPLPARHHEETLPAALPDTAPETYPADAYVPEALPEAAPEKPPEKAEPPAAPPPSESIDALMMALKKVDSGPGAAAGTAPAKEAGTPAAPKETPKEAPKEPPKEEAQPSLESILKALEKK